MADALSNDVAISLQEHHSDRRNLIRVDHDFYFVSGAHFNPAVSFVFYLRGDLAGGMTLLYMIVQVCGNIMVHGPRTRCLRCQFYKYRLSTAVDLGIVSVKLLRPLGWCL